MEFEIVENASVFKGRLFEVSDLTTVNVPEYLEGRVETVEYTERVYENGVYLKTTINAGLWRKSDFVTAEGDNIAVNGNDLIIANGRIMLFKPVVEIVTSMGEGYIVISGTRKLVNNSPVCDFDWQDERFETTYAQMCDFVTKANH